MRDFKAKQSAPKRARRASMSFLAARRISFATRAAAAILNISPRILCSPALMAGSMIDGVQSRHIISTTKHFALNAQETDRVVLDARIDPAAMRELDLLAFEIAIERGRPGAVMCAYNQVNGRYACENDWLLNQVLKTDWRYPYFVMSDWGAVHSTVPAAMAGLDQESGEQLDTQNFFAGPLAQAIAEGEVPEARLDDMARRILTSIFAHGLADKTDGSEPVDFASSDRTALAIEREGVVLLRNQGLLPLSADLHSLVVIGAHADRGVPSGGGSSQVIPRGGIAAKEPLGVNRAMIFDPGSPLEAIRLQFPRVRVDFDDGSIPARAAKAAAKADAVILFVDQWMTESADAPSLKLPGEQDQLIEAVTHANPRTAVVLETGGPVAMPWLERTAAVLEAWYPGQMGAEAIAEILSGAANPSGRLPVTFPVSEDQLPHPKIQGDPNGAPIGPVGRGGRYGAMFTAVYDEGAEVGYKWFFERGERPLFPFGFGLSYAKFALSGLAVNVSGAHGDGKRDRAQLKRTGRRGDPGILCVRTERREHPAAPRWLGKNRSEARRRAASDRRDRSTPACDIRRGRAVLANRAGRLSADGGIRFAATGARREIRASIREPAALRKADLFVRADVHPLARGHRRDQFDGGDDRPGPFPELRAFRRDPKDPYARIVFVRPERLVVYRPDFLDPIPIVDDLRMTGDRYIFLASVVRQREANRLVAPDLLRFRRVDVGQEIDRALFSGWAHRHRPGAHMLTLTVVGDHHGDRDVVDQRPNTIDVCRSIGHGRSFEIGRNGHSGFRSAASQLSFCSPSTGRCT